MLLLFSMSYVTGWNGNNPIRSLKRCKFIKKNVCSKEIQMIFIIYFFSFHE